MASTAKQSAITAVIAVSLSLGTQLVATGIGWGGQSQATKDLARRVEQNERDIRTLTELVRDTIAGKLSDIDKRLETMQAEQRIWHREDMRR